MPAVHVVTLKFNDQATQKEIQSVVDDMYELKNKCLHPGDLRPYILSIKGGPDKNGLNHIFVLEFNNVADKDWWFNGDPSHILFKHRSESVVGSRQDVGFAVSKSV